MYSDLQTIAPEQYMKTITKRLADLHAVSVSFKISLDSALPAKYLKEVDNELLNLFYSFFRALKIGESLYSC